VNSFSVNLHRARLNFKGMIKIVLRIILGIFMLYAGIGHLTFLREEFYAQVPKWLILGEGFMDFIVIASGLLEIIIGGLLIIGGKFKIKTGITLAIFFVLVFPGNINQYIYSIDAFGLDTDIKRLVRMFFQPVLIVWSLWSTEYFSRGSKIEN
jgi:uncharacterized membrane protein